jgi:hypothetical protein
MAAKDLALVAQGKLSEASRSVLKPKPRFFAALRMTSEKPALSEAKGLRMTEPALSGAKGSKAFVTSYKRYSAS